MKKVKKVKRRRFNWKALPVILGFIALIGAGIGGFFYFEPYFLKSDTITAQYKSKFNPYNNISFTAFASPQTVKIVGDVDTSKKGDYTITYKKWLKTRNVKVSVADTEAPKIETKTVKSDALYQPNAKDFIKSSSDSQPVSYSFKEEIDTSAPGKYDVTIVAKDTDGNTSEKKAVFERIEDTSAPSIEGLEKEYHVLQGNNLENLDVKIKDDLDPNPTGTLDTSQVDFTKPGSYEAIYTVADRSGNKTESVTTIAVDENPEYNQKVVYLTFDDGPSYNTKDVLDILKKYDVKATFFVTGNGEEYRDMIKRAHDEGHTIGLHTYSHDYASLYASTDAYFKDLQQVSDLVESITGEKSNIIRFPGGSSNTVSKNYSPGIMSTLTKMVGEKGYYYFDWNVSSSDASGNNVPVENIVKSAEEGAGSSPLVILFHDTFGKDTTVEALPKIIEFYKSKGYTFAALNENSYGAHHGVNN